MKNLFKRYNTYQFLINIPSELQNHFGCKLYIMSLGTQNKATALKSRHILYNKFQIIKDGVNMKLPQSEIKKLALEFKNTKLDDVLSDFNYISKTRLDNELELYKYDYENKNYSRCTEMAESILTTIDDKSEHQFHNVENVAKIIMEHVIDKLTDIKNGVNNEIKHNPNLPSSNTHNDIPYT